MNDVEIEKIFKCAAVLFNVSNELKMTIPNVSSSVLYLSDRLLRYVELEDNKQPEQPSTCNKMEHDDTVKNEIQDIVKEIRNG